MTDGSSQTDGSSEPAPRGGSTPSDSSRTRGLQAIVAAIGLAAFLVSPILGCLLLMANNENDANRRTIAEQRATIDELRDANRMLRALAANPIVQADPSPSPSPSPATGRQLRSGTLLLPYLYCVDLDTIAVEYWRMTNADCGNGADLLLGQDYQGLRATAGTLDPAPNGRASFAGCHSGGMIGQTIPYSELISKRPICARTSANNVALLEVVSIEKGPAHPDLITFNVTVWAP